MGKTTKDRRDIYYRMAKEQGLRARSAFKLLQVNETCNLFETNSRSSEECGKPHAPDAAEVRHVDIWNSDVENNIRPKRHRVVIDLCAAPGSWTQVLAKYFDQVIAVDLQAMNLDTAELRQKVTYLYGDITRTDFLCEQISEAIATFQNGRAGAASAASAEIKPTGPCSGSIVAPMDIDNGRKNEEVNKKRRIEENEQAMYRTAEHRDGSETTTNSEEDAKNLLHVGKADLLVMDGAPDVTLIHDFDEYVQHLLIKASLNVAIKTLKPGANFIAKLFRGPENENAVVRLMKRHFAEVVICKPRASRASSPECFIVGKGFFQKIVQEEKDMAIGRAEIFTGAATGANEAEHGASSSILLMDDEEAYPYVSCVRTRLPTLGREDRMNQNDEEQPLPEPVDVISLDQEQVPEQHILVEDQIAFATAPSRRSFDAVSQVQRASPTAPRDVTSPEVDVPLQNIIKREGDRSDEDAFCSLPRLAAMASTGTTTRAAPARPARFLQCGARNAPDSDRNYELAADHVFTEPVQRPIKPFYEDALSRKRGGKK
ncbi:unnamed protein product [Amoebophrya sp. A120]|nr:unnamed protein product [Amoebophrya sp. A120]|eukprot:GSA120T00021475001.1